MRTEMRREQLRDRNGFDPSLSQNTAPVGSELQLQGELNLTRRSEVARRKACGRDPSEAAGRIRVCCRRGRNRKIRIPKVRVVEKIEQFRSELQVDPFRKLGVLDRGEVRVQKTRTRHGITPQIAKMAGLRIGAPVGKKSRTGELKCRRIAEPLSRPPRRRYRSCKVRPESSQAGRPGKASYRGDDIQRVASLHLVDQPELPPSPQPVLVERELLEPADHEAMPDVEVRQTAIVVHVQAILKNGPLTIKRIVVNRLGERVRAQELQPARKVLVDRHPQAVVAGVRGAIHIGDVSQFRTWTKWT